jgi:predicted nucleic acid-binding protein
VTLHYLDSSAWVKRYFLEPGSEWMLNLFQSQEQLASSSLGYVELVSTLARRSGGRKHAVWAEVDVRTLLDEHWREFVEMPLEMPVLQLAKSLAWAKRLRGADAIHLAAADVLRQRLAKHAMNLTLVTADLEMAAAARSIDLDVINPTEIL